MHWLSTERLKSGAYSELVSVPIMLDRKAKCDACDRHGKCDVEPEKIFESTHCTRCPLNRWSE